MSAGLVRGFFVGGVGSASAGPLPFSLDYTAKRCMGLPAAMGYTKYGTRRPLRRAHFLSIVRVARLTTDCATLVGTGVPELGSIRVVDPTSVAEMTLQGDPRVRSEFIGLCPLQSSFKVRRAFPIFAVRCVAAPTAAARRTFIMHWPPHVAMLRGLGRVVDPTAAEDVPFAQAPSEREEEGKNLGRNPPPNAATCALDTSPTDNGNETHWAPHALAFAGRWDVMATL